MLKTLAICWIMLIAVGHALPGSDLLNTVFLNIPHFDKLVHLGMFLTAYFLVTKAFLQQYSQSYNRYLVVWLIAYGLLLEYLQGAIFIDRSMDVYDVLADVVGVFSGLLLYRKFPFYLAAHSNKKD